MNAPSARKVVFVPDLVGGSLVDADCRAVLDQWRDGLLVPVVTREMLRGYIRVLEGLGVPERLLKIWALWFTSPATSIFLSELPSIYPADSELSIRTAILGGCETVIYASWAPRCPTCPERLKLVSAAEYLRSPK